MYAAAAEGTDAKARPSKTPALAVAGTATPHPKATARRTQGVTTVHR